MNIVKFQPSLNSCYYLDNEPQKNLFLLNLFRTRRPNYSHQLLIASYVYTMDLFVFMTKSNVRSEWPFCMLCIIYSGTDRQRDLILQCYQLNIININGNLILNILSNANLRTKAKILI
jgi:hypothetical protein